MKNYESSLFSVFQVLYSNILCGKYPIVDCSDHVKHFMQSLNSDSSPKAIKAAVVMALEESKNCNLCLECKKCSQRFYLAVAKELLKDDYDSDFSQKETELGVDNNLSFRELPTQLRTHIETHKTMHHDYSPQQYISGQHDVIKNELIMLKGMSSSSPYIYNNIYNTKHYTGGGFYININGFGIAVDPGYGFVENMHKNKISIYDINAVIITHSHIDHTNDMRIIDDLNYQFHKNRSIPAINWYIDGTSHDTLFNGFDSQNNISTIITAEKFNKDMKIHDDVVLHPFHTVHIKDYQHSTKEQSIFQQDTFGFVLAFNIDGNVLKIGYTSDTAYYDGLEQHMENCDIIIANISGIYLDDYLLIKQKDNHLGYMGCYNLLSRLTTPPKITIISEFWNGTTDMRFDVCQVLYNDLKRKTKIFPGEIGMHLDLSQLCIKCSQCGKYAPLEDVSIIRPNEDFDTVMYVCKDCIY